MKTRRINLKPRFKIFEVKEDIRPAEETEPPQKKIKREPSAEKVVTNITAELQPTEPYTFKRAIRKTYADYCEEASIHGVAYLHQHRHILEKLFWFLLIIFSLILCITQIKNQYERWRTSPVILSFSDDPIPVSHIPFPAVTICSETKSIKDAKINFTRFINYLHGHFGKLVQPPPWLNDDEFQKMRSLLQVCGNYLSKGIRFPEYPPMCVSDQLNAIVPPFKQTFSFCSFKQIYGPCGPLLEKIYTQEGICYTFNSLNESELYREDTYQYQYFHSDTHFRRRNDALDWDLANGYRDLNDYSTFPERVIGCGPRAGFFITLEGLEKDLDYICRGPLQGFKVILHSPDDVPQVQKHFIHVPYESDVVILVKPYYVFTTDNIKQYLPEARKCYYPKERYLKFFRFYTQNNCELECVANFTLRECGCVHFSMARLNETLVCDASKISCFDQAENDFLRSEYTGTGDQLHKCNCLPSCYTLDYNHEVSQGILNIHRMLEAYDFLYNGMFDGARVSRLAVYFKDNELTGLQRSELYGITDFLSNCGGLFGLFLGVSALGLIELLYHFTFRLYRNVKAMKRVQDS